MTPRLRPCGDPSCHICRWRDTDPPDSGHPVDDDPRKASSWENESLASLLLGAAILVAIFVLAFVVLPVLAS